MSIIKKYQGYLAQAREAGEPEHWVIGVTKADLEWLINEATKPEMRLISKGDLIAALHDIAHERKHLENAVSALES